MGTVLAMVVALMAPPATATLELNLKPDSATVHIDGKQVKLRKGLVKVAPGKRSVKVSAKGYRSAAKTVTAIKGKVVTLKINLVKAGAPAKKPVAKKPAAKAPAKKPVARRPAKKPVGKRPAKTPVRKPVAKRPVRKPAKKPVRKPAEKPVAKRPAGARPVGAQPVRDTRQPAAPSYRGYAVVSFLVGGAATAGGVILGMQADEKADAFNRSTDRFEKQELKDDTEFRATAANVLYGVGAAGVVIGALLWAAEPDYRASIAPMPGGGTYVGFEGRF